MIGLGSLMEATARARSALEGGGSLTRAHSSSGMDIALYPEDWAAPGSVIKAGSIGAIERLVVNREAKDSTHALEGQRVD